MKVNVWMSVFLQNKFLQFEVHKWNWMSVQSWWHVDNFKSPSHVGGELGSNYYYGENLAWLLALQLQAKFKLEAVVWKWKSLWQKKTMTWYEKHFFLGRIEDWWWLNLWGWGQFLWGVVGKRNLCSMEELKFTSP
jgi:hypothetical protein